MVRPITPRLFVAYRDVAVANSKLVEMIENLHAPWSEQELHDCLATWKESWEKFVDELSDYFRQE